MWAWGSNAQGQLGRLECAERSHHPTAQPRPGGFNNTKTVFGGFTQGTGCEVYGAPAAGRQETPAPLELSLRWRPYRPEPRERNRLRDVDLEPVRFRQVAAAGHYTVAISAPPAAGTPEAAAAEAAAAKVADKPPSNLVTDASKMGSDVFTAVSATMGGQVYTFGYGDTGQLGHGVGFQPGVMDCYRALVPTPVAALEGVDIVQVSAGRHHVVAVTKDGRVYTWGSNLYGQLGHGDRRTRFVPKIVDALLGVNITSVSAAGYESTHPTVSSVTRRLKSSVLFQRRLSPPNALIVSSTCA